jgi:hypothetical protein
MSYSHPLPKLEKRGGSVSSRSSSYSSLDSESASTPDAPVLQAAYIDDGGNQCQKRKAVDDAEAAAKKIGRNEAARELAVNVVPIDAQKTKYNEDRRNAYAQKKELQGKPDALKEWRTKQQEATRNSNARRVKEIEVYPYAMAAAKEKARGINAWYHTKRLASFKANPAAKSAWDVKKKQGADRSRANKIAKFDGDTVAIAQFDNEVKAAAKLKRDGKKKDKKEYDSQRKKEQFAKFATGFDDKHEAEVAWELEKKSLNRIRHLKHKKKKALEKKAMEDAELLMSLRDGENEIEEGEDDNATLGDTNQGGGI